MKRTFYDQWHRIAGLRLGLRPGVVARLHHYRDEPWYVLHQQSHAGYFRLSPQTYRFVCRLNPGQTIDELWRQAVDMDPAQAPGQEEVFELITALHRQNLLAIEGGVDEGKLIERPQRKKKKPWANRISELMFMRIPLWDPEPWLKRHQSLFARLWSWPSWLLIALTMAWALLEFVLAGPRVWTQASEILQLGNLLPLYLAIFFNHFLHEMAHALACKYYGGQVRTMGVMLLLFTPLPYVDLSSSWTFRNRWHRAWVSSAGMATDLFVGAVATIVWAYSPPGLVNELAYNLMFSTAVYTFIFNINPLMRFDGYYVLSDALGLANLHESAQQQFMRWWKARVLGQPDTADVDRVSPRRHAALALFFAGSNVYRWAVMLGIVLFVADQYWGLGLVVGLALLYSSFVAPLKKVIRPLRNPLFLYQQQGKLRLSAAAVLLLLALLFWMPVPESRVLRGVVEAGNNTTLFSQSSARIVKVHASSGQWVAAGQLLIDLENPELDEELRAVRAQITQARAQERKALTEASVDLGPIREKLSTLMQTQAYILQQIQALRMRAPHDGLWHSTDAIHLAGNWVARGKELGRVVDERSHIFLGVVKQEASLNWDRLKAEGSQVRIEGERATEHRVTALTVVPHSQKELPSAALTPLAGGDLAVSAQDQTGRKAVEQFFLLRAQLGSSTSQGPEAASRNGRSGWIRVQLPARPLAERLWQWAQQFFQRRYQV